MIRCRVAEALLTATLPHATVDDMDSKLANYAEQQLIEAAKRMTREQRLRAFIEHSKRMVRLQRAGKALRGDPPAESTSSGTSSLT